MTDRRKKMVQKAFMMLDKDGSGKITIADISKWTIVCAHSF